MLIPVQTVDEQIAAYLAGDAARFAALYAEDATCIDLPSGTIVANGRVEIEVVWGRLFAVGTRLLRVVNRIASGPYVTDLEHVYTLETRRLVEALAIYRVENGLIKAVWFPKPVIIREDIDWP